jgi:tRNA G10  N-methylase Trm11
MPNYNYLYSFNYDSHNSELCKLESRQLFNQSEKYKILFSDIKVDPSISPFIKNRFEIITSSDSYTNLITNIKEEDIHIDGFKAEYLILDGDNTDYDERRKKLKDIGYSIVGEPDFENPSIIYSICIYNNIWYFGVLIKHNMEWQKHKKKPFSFSNSIGMDIAKTLVALTSKGDKTKKLLDACSGVGTVILEACIAELNIEGCDINPKRYEQTLKNIKHYDYTSNIYCTDIKDHVGSYDCAIVDLPYNLYSLVDDSTTEHIINSTVKLADRVVIVSTSDIKETIKKSGLKVKDFCIVEKRGKSKFARKIWVCEKE